MKLKVLALFTLVLSLVAASVHAGPVGGSIVRVNFANSSVGGVSWVPVVLSSSRGIKGLSIFSSAAKPIEIGAAFAGEVADSELAQVIVPPALSLVGAPGAVFYPIALGYGSRISIRVNGSVGEVVDSGELDMTLIYN